MLYVTIFDCQQGHLVAGRVGAAKVEAVRSLTRLLQPQPRKSNDKLAGHDLVTGGKFNRSKRPTNEENFLYEQCHNQTCHGFDTIRRSQNNKVIFDAAGTDGLISFVKAQILSGVTDIEAIVDEAIAVTGCHVECRMRAVIAEGANLHWRINPCGRLAVLYCDHA